MKSVNMEYWEKGEEPFCSQSSWWVNGPKTVEDWKPTGLGFEFSLHVLYLILTREALWDEVKKDPGEGGFMFCTVEWIKKIDDYKEFHECGHSGASFGVCMRVMQAIAGAGSFPAYVEQRHKTLQR